MNWRIILAQTAKAQLAAIADRRVQQKIAERIQDLEQHPDLQSKPLSTVQAAARALNLTEPTVRSSFNHLAKLGIVSEVSGRQRGQVFAYKAYVGILNEGTEPFPSAGSSAGALA